MITAPFNFVPLNEEVYSPDWADEISHDIPFEDGESGTLDITITAKSPIFIRNHYAEGDAFVTQNDRKVSIEFCHYNGTPYIPAASIKGMTRSVMEILSFSKLSEALFDDDTFAVRDLSSAKNFYMTQMNQPVYAGWLVREAEGYVIEDCGEPARIHHKEIDKAFPGINFAQKFKPGTFDAKDEEQKSAKYKYDLIGGTHRTIKVGERYKSRKNPKYDRRQFCSYKADGEVGTLVLTGQPTARKDNGKMGDGKGFEFVFLCPENPKRLKVPKEVMEKFKFAYFDGRTTQPKESPDWTFWKEKLEAGTKVPVFFQKSGNGTLLHFGLSYLYKLPYKHSVKDGIPKAHFTDELDMAESIFGYVSGKEALKGRVQFSHFRAVNGWKSLGERTEILGTPRASYYPMYVAQDPNSSEYKTFMDDGFAISGRKRYPIHRGSSVVKTVDTGNENVGTTFKPLKEGVVFQGKVRYHNLKKAELGALLSALTFHGTAQCFHNIGMAKPLGYGKVELKIEGIDPAEYLQAFELEMRSVDEAWDESPQVVELLTMASEQHNSGSSELVYIDDVQRFAKEKNSRAILKRYTQLENIVPVKPKSYVSQEDLTAMEAKRAEREEARRRKREAQERAEAERKAKEERDTLYAKAMEAEDAAALQSFIDRYPDDEAIDEVKAKIEALKAAASASKHEEVNAKAKNAYDALMKKKGKKGFDREKQKFIKKWKEKKNNKGSEVVLEYVAKVEKMK